MKKLILIVIVALGAISCGCSKPDDSEKAFVAPPPTPNPVFNGYTRKRFPESSGWVADVSWFAGEMDGVTCWTTVVGFDASGNPIVDSDGNIVEIHSLPQKRGYASAVEVPQTWVTATITVFCRDDFGGTTSNQITIAGPS